MEKNPCGNLCRARSTKPAYLFGFGFKIMKEKAYTSRVNYQRQKFACHIRPVQHGVQKLQLADSMFAWIQLAPVDPLSKLSSSFRSIAISCIMSDIRGTIQTTTLRSL